MANLTFDRYMSQSGRQAELDAIRRTPGGYEQAKAQYERQGYYGQAGQPQTAEEAMNQMMGELERKYTELGERYLAYEEATPFSFDEALARASGEERLGPYYKAELDDYIGGIERQRESVEGERTLLTELNRIATGREKRDLEEAIKASEEGFAGAGLYESGARLRETGLQEIGGAERRKEREARLGYGVGALGRREEEIGAGERTYRRRAGAEEETALLTDIEQQRRQKRAQWEVGRMEALGPEFMGRQLMGGGLESFLGQAYQ